MKHLGWAAILALGLFSSAARGQGTSLDVLEQDLNQIKQERQTATAQSISTMLDQLTAGMASPDAAIDLYQKAGGTMPTAAPVETKYEHETPDEKAKRTAKDAANVSDMASIVQLHCGMMRFGVIFVLEPDTKNLESDWEAWLKTAATIYGKLASFPELKTLPLSKSPFNAYFTFNSWGTKEQAKWTVAQLPVLFRKQIIDPARLAHSADLLADWDLYIGMRSADQPDQDTWTRIDLPHLQFERASDDFHLAPSTEKLAVLIGIIKANPTHPRLDEWIASAKDMLQVLRGAKSGDTTPAQPPST